MKLKKNQSLYLQHAVQELVEDKIDLHFSRTRKVEDCAGYFDYLNKELKVATWRKDWFGIFMHEYNHYKQWKKQTKKWQIVEHIDTFFDTFPKKYTLGMQLMEQECDKMVWSDVEEWHIEGMQNHIAEANSYHISYVNIANNRKWVKRGAYNFPEIVKLCPNDRFFNVSELSHPKHELYSLIDDLCF